MTHCFRHATSPAVWCFLETTKLWLWKISLFTPFIIFSSRSPGEMFSVDLCFTVESGRATISDGVSHPSRAGTLLRPSKIHAELCELRARHSTLFQCRAMFLKCHCSHVVTLWKDFDSYWSIIPGQLLSY